jgi:hypothetical protein
MNLRTFLLLSALTISAPVAALADSQTAAAPTGDQPGRPSAAVMQHLADGRVAFIEAALNLTSEQQKAWSPVADLLRQPPRPNFEGHKPGEHAASLSDMLTRQADAMNNRAAYEQKLASALKSLEATLSPEQKETLKIAFFTSMPHPHGRPGFDGGWGHRPGDHPEQPGNAPAGDQSQPG